MAAFTFVQMKSYNAGTSFGITSVNAHVGGNTTYNGSFGNDLAGHTTTITGLAASNNGSFTVQSNTTTQMVVNNGGGTTQTAAGTASFPTIDPNFVQITPTTGNWLIVAVWIGNSSPQTVSSVADTTSNAYSFCTNTHVNNGGVNSGTTLELWYAPVTTGGLTTVTATWPSLGGYSNISVAEYSGVTAFDFGTSLSGNLTTDTITLGTPTSNELLVWAILLGGFPSIVWGPGPSGVTTMVSRASNNNGGPIANSTYSFGDQPNPGYYTTGTTTVGSATQFIMNAAVFKTSTSVSNSLSPFQGYGVYDCGGVALPAQEPTSTIFANQFNFLPAPVTNGSRGPTNAGVAYQGTGGGATSGFGQIYPTGREPIG